MTLPYNTAIFSDYAATVDCDDDYDYRIMMM